MADKPDFWTGWVEPESAANTSNPPIYPYNNITQTESGHSYEMDDTPGRERIRLQHRTGTFIEMHPNGDEVHKVYGDGYEITIKDKNILIKGKMNITVEGDAYINVKGDKIEQVDGNYELLVKGNYTQTVEKQTYMASQGDTTLVAGGSIDGSLNIITGDSMTIQGDISVEGEVSATKMTALRMDAVMGMSAGIHGFVTQTGGIAVGPNIAAIPTTINAVGPINSLTSISAPLGTFGVSGSVLAYDVINLLLHNIHIHPAPHGTTGTPTPLEIA